MASSRRRSAGVEPAALAPDLGLEQRQVEAEHVETGEVGALEQRLGVLGGAAAKFGAARTSLVADAVHGGGLGAGSAARD